MERGHSCPLFDPRGFAAILNEAEKSLRAPFYALTAARFPALARFGLAGDKGRPNLSRLPMVAVYLASASHNSRVQSETQSGARTVVFAFMVLRRLLDSSGG